MEPIVIERCLTPRGELQLQKRGEHYEIISNGAFLMATYNGESERLLVKTAIQSASSPRRVLIGGLGVGFSLAEAVSDKRVEQVTVLEIEEKIIAWNRRQLSPFSQHALADSRVQVIKADLLQWMENSPEQFDAVCLDIDNGPDWTVTEENASLYSEAGLRTLRSLLAPGGAITFWSSSPSPEFAERLGRHFAYVETMEVELPRLAPDFIYLAKR